MVRDAHIPNSGMRSHIRHINATWWKDTLATTDLLICAYFIQVLASICSCCCLFLCFCWMSLVCVSVFHVLQSRNLLSGPINCFLFLLCYFFIFSCIIDKWNEWKWINKTICTRPSKNLLQLDRFLTHMLNQASEKKNHINVE